VIAYRGGRTHATVRALADRARVDLGHLRGFL